MQNRLIDIITYNILCGKLGEEHIQSAPFNDSKIRLEKIKSILKSYIEKNYVICLQEIGLQWAGSFTAFFQRRNYTLIYASYGRYHNDYMGVAIAVPNLKYDIIDSLFFKPSSLKKWPTKEKSIISPFIDSILSLMKYYGFVNYVDEWKISKLKENICIALTLMEKNTGKEVVVGTYHMPCNFNEPQVMMIHSSLVARGIQEYAKAKPYILAGDFNIKPAEHIYAFLTKGWISPDSPNYPKCDYDPWIPTLLEPLKSAYFEFLGNEPEFTNCGSSGEKPVFIGTLDYIFYSSRLTVIDVVSLPELKDLESCRIPNKDYPSDHLLLGASFS